MTTVHVVAHSHNVRATDSESPPVAASALRDEYATLVTGPRLVGD